MLQHLNQYSKWRWTWLLLALSVLFIEIIASFFHHILMFKPCTMCIYEHCALFGIMIAGLVGSISPKNALFRCSALVIWIYSSWKGIYLSYEHAMIQLHPYISVCESTIRFPSWIPINKWLTTVFISDNCTSNTWSFLMLSMPQWLIVIFSFYFIIALLGLIAQPFKLKHRDLFNG